MGVASRHRFPTPATQIRVKHSLIQSVGSVASRTETPAQCGNARQAQTRYNEYQQAEPWKCFPKCSKTKTSSA